jgi:hypothetical protein
MPFIEVKNSKKNNIRNNIKEETLKWVSSLLNLEKKLL